MIFQYCPVPGIIKTLQAKKDPKKVRLILLLMHDLGLTKVQIIYFHED